MQISIERDPLIQALGQVMGAVDTKHTIPVLSNVLLETVGSSLRIVGTNLDIEVSTQIDAHVVKPGRLTAPARELADIAAKALPGAQIAIVFDPAGDKRMKVTAGRSNYMLPTLPASDFPTMAAIDGGVSYSLLAESLSRLLGKVEHAMSSDVKTRYYLAGMRLHTVQDDGTDYLRTAATDGHRIAFADTPAPEGSTLAPPVTIPRATVALIQRIVGGRDGDVGLTVSAAKILVRAGNTVLVSKLIDGGYVDYVRPIPTGKGTAEVRLRASDLARGIDAAGIVNREKTLLLRFDFRPDGLAISGKNNDGGVADAEIETTHEGADILIGFNAKLLRDVAGVIGDGDMICQIWDKKTPIRIAEVDDPTVTYSVAPSLA
jgi:DNA polymerase-3 subunit beta